MVGRCDCHITPIKQAVNVSTEQETIRRFVHSLLRVGPDVRRIEARGDLDRINCLIPSREVMEVLDNKYECNRFLAVRGFGAHVPAMLGDEDIGRLDAWPIIYKKKYDAYGTQSFLWHSRAELEAIEAATVQTEYFRQEYVPGEDRAELHRTRALAHLRRRRLTPHALDEMRRVEGVTKGRVKATRPPTDSGTSCFNYKMVAGKPKIFEINPRFGQSLARDINNYSTPISD